MDRRGLEEPASWCGLSFAEQRRLLAEALTEALAGAPGVEEVVIEAGTPGREYDLTAMVQSDVGRLRTPLWSHGRAVIYCDASVHEANRKQLAPARAVAEAADRLRRRLAVEFRLESRGLTLTLAPEEGVERTWTAERSLFRNRTAVTREDRVLNAGEVDVRDLLAHFYVGPSLRVAGEGGEPFLLPDATEAEGPLVSLCWGGGHFAEGSHASCPTCGGGTDVVIAARPPRR